MVGEGKVCSTDCTVCLGWIRLGDVREGLEQKALDSLAGHQDGNEANRSACSGRTVMSD
jgi:hypothetical protein